MMQSTELYDPDHLLRDCVPHTSGNFIRSNTLVGRKVNWISI